MPTAVFLGSISPRICGSEGGKGDVPKFGLSPPNGLTWRMRHMQLGNMIGVDSFTFFGAYVCGDCKIRIFRTAGTFVDLPWLRRRSTLESDAAKSVRRVTFHISLGIYAQKNYFIFVPALLFWHIVYTHARLRLTANRLECFVYSHPLTRRILGKIVVGKKALFTKDDY